MDAKMKAKLRYRLCCVIRVSEFESLICKVFFNPTSKEEPVCTEILKGTFEPLYIHMQICNYIVTSCDHNTSESPFLILNL